MARLRAVVSAAVLHLHAKDPQTKWLPPSGEIITDCFVVEHFDERRLLLILNVDVLHPAA